MNPGGRLFNRFILACLLVAVWACGAMAKTVPVELPLILDYGFLRSSLLSQFYTRPGGRALAGQKDQGCTQIELWDPGVSAQNGRLVIRTRVRVKAGMRILGKCLDPLDWQGIIEVSQQVMVDRRNWVFRVKSLDSKLFDAKGGPAMLANAVYSLTRDTVHAYLDQFSVNLAPSRSDLAKQLPLLFQAPLRPKVDRWLQTLRLEDARVEKEAVRIPMRMEVEAPPERSAKTEPMPAPGPEQIAAFCKFWESWDAFLVRQILSLAGNRLTQNEKDTLLTTLLDTRYAFVEALQKPAKAEGLVRRQFLEAWRSLSPILRKYLMKNPSPSLLNYLAFFTASDALTALDKLGPTLGLSISQEGLMRLAALIHRGKVFPADGLKYSPGVDPRLRKLLGFGPEPDAGPARPGPDPKPKAVPGPGSWLRWLVTPAQADDGRGLLLAWLPSKSDPESYLAKVKKLLDQKADQSFAGLSGISGAEFRLLVRSVAWQESCFRQFIRKNGELTYMLSYNNSSVGIMQINERIWRGLYEPTRLRWEIGYNTAAGCEISALYLRRYVQRKMDPNKPFDAELQARLVYAIYNGGPSQYRKFLKRLEKGRFFLSDRLFLQKYRWAKAGDYHEADRCLLHPEDHP